MYVYTYTHVRVCVCVCVKIRINEYIKINKFLIESLYKYSQVNRSYLRKIHAIKKGTEGAKRPSLFFIA